MVTNFHNSFTVLRLDHWQRSLLSRAGSGPPTFLYPMGKYSCLPYHFSASKLIFFYHFISNTCRQWMQILLSILKPWQNSIFSWKKCRQLPQQSPQAPTTHFATESMAPSPQCCLPTLNDLLLPMSRQKTRNKVVSKVAHKLPSSDMTNFTPSYIANDPYQIWRKSVRNFAVILMNRQCLVSGHCVYSKNQTC